MQSLSWFRLKFHFRYLEHTDFCQTLVLPADILQLLTTWVPAFLLCRTLAHLLQQSQLCLVWDQQIQLRLNRKTYLVTFILNHLCPPFEDLWKHYKARSDAAKCSIWSVLTLYNLYIYVSIYNLCWNQCAVINGIILLARWNIPLPYLGIITTYSDAAG